MDEFVIRPLRANEIECRIGTVSEKGISLLLYKDARVDQNILDETFGIYGWKRSHQCINGSLYCTIEIYDPEKKEWVSKQDVGTTGFAEKEKSQASDSFKRAAFNVGIGRELYSAPFIWVPAGNVTIVQRGDKWFCNDRFSVQSIEYNENREICGLTIVNGKGQCVYQLIASKRGGITSKQREALNSQLRRTGIAMETALQRYHVDSPDQLTSDIYSKLMQALERTKTAEAA